LKPYNLRQGAQPLIEATLVTGGGIFVDDALACHAVDGRGGCLESLLCRIFIFAGDGSTGILDLTA